MVAHTSPFLVLKIDPLRKGLGRGEVSEGGMGVTYVDTRLFYLKFDKMSWDKKPKDQKKLSEVRRDAPRSSKVLPYSYYGMHQRHTRS